MLVGPPRVLAIDVSAHFVRGIVLVGSQPVTAGGYAQLDYDSLGGPTPVVVRIASALDVKAEMPVVVTGEPFIDLPTMGGVTKAVADVGFPEVSLQNRADAVLRANPSGGRVERLLDVDIAPGLLASHQGLTLDDLAAPVGAGLRYLDVSGGELVASGLDHEPEPEDDAVDGDVLSDEPAAVRVDAPPLISAPALPATLRPRPPEASPDTSYISNAARVAAVTSEPPAAQPRLERKSRNGLAFGLVALLAALTIGAFFLLTRSSGTEISSTAAAPTPSEIADDATASAPAPSDPVESEPAADAVETEPSVEAAEPVDPEPATEPDEADEPELVDPEPATEPDEADEPELVDPEPAAEPAEPEEPEVDDDEEDVELAAADELPPLDSLPERGAIFRPPTLFLEGPVQTQEIADQFYAAAAAVVGPDNVVNNYVVHPEAPAAVDGNVRVEQAVLFGSASATIADDFLPTLELAVAVMGLNPQVTLVVEGHTDSAGAAAANLTLSQQRAESVVEYLVGRGVPRERLEAVGFGESIPIADNDTAAGQQLNRRIEFELLNLLGVES